MSMLKFSSDFNLSSTYSALVSYILLDASKLTFLVLYVSKISEEKNNSPRGKLRLTRSG